jgi:DNA-binding GntR family transcriptional regulator
MQLEIVRGSAVPPYRQLAEQIGAAIRSGELAPGDRIPTRKELTEVYLLDLAPNTVQKAMDLLKEEGLVFTSPGLGLFVKDQAAAPE